KKYKNLQFFRRRRSICVAKTRVTEGGPGRACDGVCADGSDALSLGLLMLRTNCSASNIANRELYPIRSMLNF
ncbi:hypothetical protein J6590_103789, partial [Homalodisca vitripennis]